MFSIEFEGEHLSSKVESLDKISAKLQITTLMHWYKTRFDFHWQLI